MRNIWDATSPSYPPAFSIATQILGALTRRVGKRYPDTPVFMPFIGDVPDYIDIPSVLSYAEEE